MSPASSSPRLSLKWLQLSGSTSLPGNPFLPSHVARTAVAVTSYPDLRRGRRRRQREGGQRHRGRLHSPSLLSQGLALSLGYVQTKGGISPKSAWGHHRHPPMTDTRCRGKGSSCWFSSEAGPPGHRAPAAEAHAAGNACAQPRTLPPPERAPPPRARPGPRRPRGSYFYDFVEAFVSHHPDIRLCVITAQQKKFHSNAQKFLKFWRISKRKKKHCHSQEEPKKT